MATSIVTAPPSATSLLAEVEVRSNGEGAKTAPLAIIARTTTPVESGVKEFGRIVHDFAGMRMERSRLPVDYCHESSDVIGYANHVAIEGGALVASGALVPYAENDKAAEVIYKAQQGVPYQASIYTGADIAVEKLPAGRSAVVNGEQVDGPVSIVREWTLRGIAVCPYGRDGNTASVVAFSQGESIAMNVTEIKPPEVEAQAVEAAAEVEQQATEEQPVEVAKVEEPAAPEAVPVEAVAMSEGKRFLTAFGAQGGVWFAEGKTFEEAQRLHADAILKENADLKAQLQDAVGKLAALRGEETPVRFAADAGERDAKLSQFANKLPDGLARFAAGVKFTNKTK